MLEFSLVLFLINSIINAHERLRQTKLKQAFHLEISVYSRSDKHLISKMEKPKVAKSKLELFGDSLSKLLFGFQFPNCLFVFLRLSHFSFYLIPHFTPQAVGGGFPPVFGPMDRVYPPSPPCLLHPFCRRCAFVPLCRVGFSPFLTSVLRSSYSLLANGYIKFA